MRHGSPFGSILVCIGNPANSGLAFYKLVSRVRVLVGVCLTFGACTTKSNTLMRLGLADVMQAAASSVRGYLGGSYLSSCRFCALAYLAPLY